MLEENLTQSQCNIRVTQFAFLKIGAHAIDGLGGGVNLRPVILVLRESQRKFQVSTICTVQVSSGNYPERKDERVGVLNSNCLVRD